MSLDLDEMLEECFAALGEEVTYRPAAGGSTTVTVLPAAADRVTPFAAGSAIQSSPAAVFEVRVAALSQPVRGDELDYKLVTYKVKSFRLKDNEQLIWLLDCYPA